MAGLEVEGLFTTALGLAEPWKVDKVELNTAKRRINFEVVNTGGRMACPACGALGQAVHERARRSWRQLDFFQFEAWLHASIPRVGCSACGKTSQEPVPWAREGSGFTMLFEALAISLCQELPVRQAAQTHAAHQPLHCAAGHLHALTLQMVPDLIGAVDPKVRLPHALDLRHQYRIALGPGAQPLGVALGSRMAPVRRRGDLQCLADRLDPVRGTMRVDERLHDFRRR